MSTELNGRVALVTGGTSDTGRAIARALLARGATVHVTGRRAERFEALPGLIPHVAELDAPGIMDLLAVLGPIDVLVHNAAHPPERAPLLEGSMATMRAIMETNFWAALMLVQGVLPGMLERGWGRLVAISSLAASIGEAHGPAYCASKAALEGLWRNLAIDYSPRGVTANVVAPGPILTERLEGWGAPKIRRLGLASAVRRVCRPDEVAAAVAFLAAPEAGCVTGEILRVDGGLHLGNPLAAMYVREGRGEGT